jgi:hypothetical protein
MSVNILRHARESGHPIFVESFIINGTPAFASVTVYFMERVVCR